MKKIILSAWLIFSMLMSYAQSPKIAVVNSMGVTTIFSDILSAYNYASNGDAIYLNGGVHHLNALIGKEIHIYGAGIDPDSCNVISRTLLQVDYIGQGATNSTFEGVVFVNTLQVYTYQPPPQNLKFKRCQFNSLLHLNWATNCIVEDCIILGGIQAIYTSMIQRNIFSTSAWGIASIYGGQVRNNIFLNAWENIFAPDYTTMDNNIFLGGNPISGAVNSNVYHNNLKIGTNPLAISPTDIETNTMSENLPSDIFLNYPIVAIAFDFILDFHLRSSCVGHNAGTDGTDVGIYGTNYPVPEGWVPSNPHIYYKSVAEESNTNGKLPVHFKVRTGN